MARRALVLSPEQYAAHQAKLQRHHEGALSVPIPAVASPEPNKHGAVKTSRGELRFDSTKEARCWDDLLLRKHAGEISHLQRQVMFPFVIDGVYVGRYRADFFLRDAQGAWTVADCKSAHTRKLPGWARTKQLLLVCYGFSVLEL